ncbi:hypothetical protein M409DRAFT_18494 [Zasmidium cellare ATCC 36951]|uniref:F-box domain-containing protein n=1 Tax=Zasmidium cellare ATCC 36951 TaxID=1080233 RepID=A0A6A6CYY4_ZASCE|nr:uncharacterized protein M409DRAFT_18494 [Zasmidium cellare ATCC 36951]KAF2171378.1 hypothetical protein M409DRAFT_18494 [Zasmidium cellare ATCC 36951]
MAPVQKRKRESDQSTIPVQMTFKRPMYTSSGIDNAFTPQEPDNPFRFHDVPREMRDNIYSKALEHDTVYLSRFSKDKTLLTDYRLVGANKQIRHEFLNAMIMSAPVIQTRVRNFNFSSLISFLNRLSDEELYKLTTDTKYGTRVMKIQLESHIPGAGGRSPSNSLQRWLNRADEPTKKGVNVEFQYEWLDDPEDTIYVAVAAPGPKRQHHWRKTAAAAGEGLMNVDPFDL